MVIDSICSVKALRAALLTVVAAAVLAGCADMEEPKARAARVQEVATKFRDENVASATSSAVQRTSRPRISGDEVVLRSLHTLPAKFAMPVSYSTHGAQGFAEVLEAVSSLAGLSVRGVEVMQTKTGSGNGFAGGTNGTNSGKLGGSVQLEYAGTLRGLLDELAARNEASWRYSAQTNSVNFFRFETRTLNVHLPPGAKNVSASITLSGVGGGGGGGGSSGGDSGGGGGSAGNVSVTQTQVIDPWTSIMNSVRSILTASGPSKNATSAGSAASGGMSGGSGGGRGAGQGGLTASGADGEASATPELGMLTVTARPQAVERIAAYINSINARFGRNVMIDVQILSVTLDNQASAGFSLDALYKQLNNNGLSIVGGAPLQPSSGSPGRLTMNIGNPNSQWSGSSIVAEALAQYGTVGLETKAQVLAINGQPAPFQVADEVTYLASSTTTTAPSVGATTALTPGSRIVGFTGNMTPTIMGDNRILLQYQMEISALVMSQATSGNATIQTPKVSKQSLQNQAYVRDGEVIVLFGFDQNRDSIDSSLGVGGASRVGRGERKMMVIVMQVSGGRKNA